ncbi:hypothetical protein ACFY2K_30520 [Kitasatospora sp. NPDC001309]|uniref:hypothetical protein n=1 Tax=Kitasatospora sp. NPDC001309 TaxID=3364013 RepID=UPI0036A00AD1
MQEEARRVASEWLGSESYPMGSSHAGSVLPESDVDLFACNPCSDLSGLRSLLTARAEYKKTRTRLTGSERFLFVFQVDEIKVDLNIVSPQDFHLAARMTNEIGRNATQDDVVVHTWLKHLAKQHRGREIYEAWKWSYRTHFSPTLRSLSTRPK